jgi:hypothetical protein
MKTFMLYRPNSEHERSVIEFYHDFTKQTQRNLELVDLNTRDGDDKAKLYGVVQYPAVIAIDDDGRMLKMWQGKLPLINELSYFTPE